jgi:hypothetical protein
VDGPAADKKSMPPVLAIVFWAWVLVSIVVFLRRRANKRAIARMEATGETPRPPTDGEEVVPAGADVPEPVHAMAGPAAPSAPTPPPGFEDPTAPIVERPVPRSAPAAGVADALVGIRMPCDLVPLVLDRLATDHITLSTTGHAAADVGTALADEVERLGYVVHPISDHEVLATRGATELRLTIRAPGPDGKHLTHPTAREDSVVVEVALG